MVVYHPMDYPLLKNGQSVSILDKSSLQTNDLSSSVAINPNDQGTKWKQMLESIRNLTAHFCAGQDYFRYDTESYEKFRQMYFEAKDDIMRVGD